MTPNASEWRSSPAYDHVDTLTASDLAWEWLRRNVDYDHDFNAFARSVVNPQMLMEKIRQQWGLQFPDRSSEGPA